MIYPCLVPEWLCKTPIHIELETEKLNENGEPEYVLKRDLLCNYQDSAKRILTPEKQLIEINGVAMFPGDIAPELPVISGGTATIFGIEREIVQGTKPRNPDGTVNFTKLELK